MKQKWVAFLTVIAIVSGFKRATKRPFRVRLLYELVQHKIIQTADEIRLNTLFIEIWYKDKNLCLMNDKMPLTDEEQEALRALLILILPKQTHGIKIYEPDVELSHQVTYRFTKTKA